MTFARYDRGVIDYRQKPPASGKVDINRGLDVRRSSMVRLVA
jgi:hypothetical protein